MDLSATVDDILRAAHGAGGLDAALATGAFGDLSSETVEAVVREAARFAGEVLAPLNQTGDRSGVAFAEGRVTMPVGFVEAYRRWAAAGWSALGAPAQWGGQAMPVSVHSPDMSAARDSTSLAKRISSGCRHRSLVG